MSEANCVKLFNLGLVFVLSIVAATLSTLCLILTVPIHDTALTIATGRILFVFYFVLLMADELLNPST